MSKEKINLKSALILLDAGFTAREIEDNYELEGCKKMQLAGHLASMNRKKNVQKNKSLSHPPVKVDFSTPKSVEEAKERAEKEYKAQQRLMHAIDRQEEIQSSKLEQKASETAENYTGPALTKAQAIEMLSQGCSPKKMAGYFKGHSEEELRAYQAHINMGTYIRNPALLEIGKGSEFDKPIRKKEQFIPFLQENQVARDLSLLALTLGADGGQIEDAIMELYSGKFKNKDELHELLQETKNEFIRILEDGVTNLGAFMGGYSLFERGMAPIILGGAANAIPLEKATPTLEKMLLRVANGIYDPHFNRDTKGTIQDLERKASMSFGLAQKIYTSLIRDYHATLAIGTQLKEIAASYSCLT